MLAAMAAASAHLGGGIGFDLISIPRLEQTIDRVGQEFLDRIFTPAEQEECASRAHPVQHYAARFAAKEAGMKVLGSGWTGGIAFTDFEVISDGKRPPEMLLHGKARELADSLGISLLQVSLSHTDDTAGAVAIAVG